MLHNFSVMIRQAFNLDNIYPVFIFVVVLFLLVFFVLFTLLFFLVVGFFFFPFNVQCDG